MFPSPTGYISVQDWSLHISFVLKGFQISAYQWKWCFESKMSIQEYRNEIQYSYKTCAWIIWYMFQVQCEETRINHVTLILVWTMSYACWILCWIEYIEDFKRRPDFQYGVAFWRVVLREVKYFEEPNKGMAWMFYEHTLYSLWSPPEPEFFFFFF